jgi:hypothetical protein
VFLSIKHIQKNKAISGLIHSHCFIELSILLQFLNDPSSASVTLVLLRRWNILTVLRTSQTHNVPPQPCTLSDPDNQVHTGPRRCYLGFSGRWKNDYSLPTICVLIVLSMHIILASCIQPAGWKDFLPRAPPNNCLVLLSYVPPDKPSILTYPRSPYSPVTRSFCVCAPNRTPCSPISAMSPAVFVWAIVWNRAEGAVQLVPFSDPFYVSTLSVFESVPIFPDLHHILLVDAVWCPASRNVYSCPCPSVGFCAV